MDDIVVVGKRYDNDVIFVDVWIIQSGGLEPHPTISPIPNGPPPEYFSYPLQIQCTSPEKLSKAVSDYMRKAVIGSWSEEYSMVVVAAGNGKFKLFQDDIKTTNESTQTVLVLAQGVPSAFPLVFHNHPTGLVPDYDLLNRYPSATDWATVTKNVTDGNLLPSVKVAIADASANVRIYNYADKAYYTGLSQSDKIAGVGLPAPVPDAAGCVTL
ncbi:hypothetical protein [Sphingomonas sp. CFBP 8765]|uniref:hypothetical protein n=1 Tax=Sphingomonas sp. CFBP 8765 TaxID=2775274 RepID=UPI00178560DE|nr:hypothetical protein [Sphingomonas sp. CFBP 8765]MBD8472167.1 hypothetical protein [Sphingomonas sp. CFBP 8765]